MASGEKPLPENSPPNGGIASRHCPTQYRKMSRLFDHALGYPLKV
jgi:hypothetical protein